MLLKEISRCFEPFSPPHCKATGFLVVWLMLFKESNQRNKTQEVSGKRIKSEVQVHKSNLK